VVESGIATGVTKDVFLMTDTIARSIEVRTPAAQATAKAALFRGEALAAEGKHAEAIAAFESVYATAPREYKMCQRAGLQTSASYKALSTRLGDEMDKKAQEAKGTVWWWGRGTRWGCTS
jgi:hypothetical protein